MGDSTPIRAWASKFGIKSIQQLIDNGVDELYLVPKISESTLDGCGIKIIGERMKIMHAVEEYKKQQSSVINVNPPSPPYSPLHSPKQTTQTSNKKKRKTPSSPNKKGKKQRASPHCTSCHIKSPERAHIKECKTPCPKTATTCTYKRGHQDEIKALKQEQQRKNKEEKLKAKKEEEEKKKKSKQIPNLQKKNCSKYKLQRMLEHMHTKGYQKFY